MQLVGQSFGTLCRRFAVDEQPQSFFEAARLECIYRVALFVERVGHAFETKSFKPLGCGMLLTQGDLLTIDSNSAHGYWDFAEEVLQPRVP